MHLLCKSALSRVLGEGRRRFVPFDDQGRSILRKYLQTRMQDFLHAQHLKVSTPLPSCRTSKHEQFVCPLFTGRSLLVLNPLIAPPPPTHTFATCMTCPLHLRRLILVLEPSRDPRAFTNCVTCPLHLRRLILVLEPFLDPRAFTTCVCSSCPLMYCSLRHVCVCVCLPECSPFAHMSVLHVPRADATRAALLQTTRICPLLSTQFQP